MDKKQIGLTLKQQRKRLGWTQKELAKGICSQALLSHLEAGDYMPAAHIFIALYQKLGLSESLMTLETYFPISSTPALNDRCESLCRAHHYDALKKFLLADETINTIRDTDFQAYYYYLGVAQIQLGDPLAAKVHLKLALAETEKTSAIARLSLACLGGIAAQAQQVKEATDYFDQAFDLLNETANSRYDENVNALFYIKAYSQKLLKQNTDALNTLEAGIIFSANHHSHYMISNFYYLAALLVDADISKQYQHNSQLFEALYHEKVFDNI